MRRRPSSAESGDAVITACRSAVAGCEAKVYGTPPAHTGAPAADGRRAAGPHGPATRSPARRARRPRSTGSQARAQAGHGRRRPRPAPTSPSPCWTARPARLVTNGNGRAIAIASVVKLFIADDLLLQVSKGQTQLSPARPQDVRRHAAVVRRQRRRDLLEPQRRQRDHHPGGRPLRAGGSTAPPGNGRWFNTISTASDLVRYYDMLLAGAGGLPLGAGQHHRQQPGAVHSDRIDGMMPGGVYPQRFGIPEGLYAEPVAVKQGWMCCIGADWMHLSTGVIGPDRRYVMAISSCSPPTTPRPARPSPRPSRRCSPAAGSSSSPSQVGPAFAGALQRLLTAPGRDSGVVAGEQHLGHVQTTPARRPGVAGPLEQARRSANHLGATADCPARRAAAARRPRSSPAPRTRRRAAHSRRSTPLRRASAGPRRRRRAGRCPRSARRRTPGAPRRSSAARSAWVNSRPAGVGTTRSVSSEQISSSASPHTGARITMPGPPPYGASSTERCTSCVHRRRSCTRRSTMPASIALPGNDCRSGSR